MCGECVRGVPTKSLDCDLGRKTRFEVEPCIVSSTAHTPGQGPPDKPGEGSPGRDALAHCHAWGSSAQAAAMPCGTPFGRWITLAPPFLPLPQSYSPRPHWCCFPYLSISIPCFFHSPKNPHRCLAATSLWMTNTSSLALGTRRPRFMKLFIKDRPSCRLDSSSL